MELLPQARIRIIILDATVVEYVDHEVVEAAAVATEMTVKTSAVVEKEYFLPLPLLMGTRQR